MTDRHRGPPTVANRSSTLSSVPSAMPTSIGYSSMLAGDMHVVPSASSRHHVTAPRTYATSSTTTTPSATIRAYAVALDPRQRREPAAREAAAREPAAREPATRESAARARRSTLDSASRPPVIVTTTHNARSRSPVRGDDYYHRPPPEARLYAQPASSLRSRSAARPYHDNLRELSHREVEAYRSSRPSVAYPSDARHSTAAIDYGDDGYQYTTAGELARYDLDLPKHSRPRRHESVDRGYYRPNINYSADQRSFNVNTSHDLSRNYNMNTSRPYDGRLSTRRFVRPYEPPARDLPPPAPVPPPPTAALLDAPAPASDRWDSTRRARPLSLHQDGPPRSFHHDEYQRSRDDERRMREYLDRPFDPPRFRDEAIASRGFGIRTDALEATPDARDRRRADALEAASDTRDRRRADAIESPPDTRDRRREPRPDDSVRREKIDETVVDEHLDRREAPDKERSRFRDKVAAGLGVAATAVGLAPTVLNDDDKKDHATREPRRRRSPTDDGQRRREPATSEPTPLQARGKDKEHARVKEGSSRDGSITSAEGLDRLKREAGVKSATESLTPPSDSDESKDEGGDEGRDEGRDEVKRTSRRPQSGAFDPNDASDLRQLRQQLAAMDASDRGAEADRGSAAEDQGQQSPAPSSTKRRGSSESTHGRELTLVSTGSKQVRVVSPPREKAEDKPLKGILKQPSPRFPEESNPVREGVAPHKEDKKLKEAPEGARWTKINRKIVNPEALTIGKERFELRDDFVIVLRVLSKEEIQAYAAATQVLRERRRNKAEGDGDQDGDQDEEAGRRQHRSHRRRDDEEQEGEDRDRDRDRDRERRRRHRRDDDEYEARPRDDDHHYTRSGRDRDRGIEA